MKAPHQRKWRRTLDTMVTEQLVWGIHQPVHTYRMVGHEVTGLFFNFEGCNYYKDYCIVFVDYIRSRPQKTRKYQKFPPVRYC